MRNKYTALLIFCLGFFTAFAQPKKDFTLEDIFKNGTFQSKGAATLNVMNNGKSYSAMISSEKSGWKICRIDLETTKDTQLIFSSIDGASNISPESYEFSADEKFLLLTEKSERIYRHSSKSLAYVVDIEKKKVLPVDNEKIMYPTLSPDNKWVAYVKENNLYLFNLITGEITIVTKDGKKNEIINGAVDWVYEEEFSMSSGFEWSPDGKYIAFYKFDESKVHEFSMPIYGNLYPQNETWKYPKAGEDNSVVNIYIYNTIEQSQAVRCQFAPADQYFPRIGWTKEPGILSVQHLNRLQNEWTLFFANAKDGSVKNVQVIKNEKFIDITDNLIFIKGKHQFINTAVFNGYNHIYLHDYSDIVGNAKPQTDVFITKGNWDVLSIACFDELKEMIYFNSAEGGATEDHFYSIQVSGKKKTNLTPEPGNHLVMLGKGNKYFTDITSTINTPVKYILRKIGSKWQRILENNNELSLKFSEYNFGKTEFGKMPLRKGDTFNYYIMKPWNFDASKKYPVLMYVYGGPGANTVRNSYGGRNYLWHQLLTEKGYIVVSVDGRGTGHRGEVFQKSTYLQLGKLELQDQTDAAKWLGKMSWVDATRIGIWGWSFGGYMSSNCITKSADVFKTAIAVAPVTNWRYYDNIYTERYMRTPQENADGYDQNSPINFVSGIKGNYLLIHGTGDDNVHFQNSVEMVNAMIKAGVKYDSEYYPNRNHGIGDRAAQYHLYRRMTDYLLEKL
jgi:dipeptidyl-peptidase-4